MRIFLKHRPINLSPVLMLPLLICLSCSKDDDIVVTKNEELYINELYASSGDDWIELYNNTTSDKDISSYKIYDDPANKYVLPANTTIPANGFMILICDDTGIGLHTNFKLDASGEVIYLENKSGEVIDKVEYPSLKNGQSYGRYPDGSHTFHTSGNTTQGATNGDTQAPVIENATRSPLVPSLNANVTITINLLSTGSPATAKLFYRINGGSYTTLEMAQTGGVFSAAIPALNTTGAVDYYVEVSGNGGKKSYSPFNAPAETFSYLLNTDPLPKLRINEFMAFNSSCCPDVVNGVNEFDDWIEIYNTGDVPVDMADFYFSDDLANPFGSKIPSGNAAKTIIPAGGFLVLWADGTKSQGALHLNFALDHLGEAVGLYYKDGRAIDTYSFGPQNENVSWGLTTDGGTIWKAFSSPTQGASNQ